MSDVSTSEGSQCPQGEQGPLILSLSVSRLQWSCPRRFPSRCSLAALLCTVFGRRRRRRRKENTGLAIASAPCPFAGSEEGTKRSPLHEREKHPLQFYQKSSPHENHYQSMDTGLLLPNRSTAGSPGGLHNAVAQVLVHLVVVPAQQPGQVPPRRERRGAAPTALVEGQSGVGLDEVLQPNSPRALQGFQKALQAGHDVLLVVGLALLHGLVVLAPCPVGGKVDPPRAGGARDHPQSATVAAKETAPQRGLVPPSGLHDLGVGLREALTDQEPQPVQVHAALVGVHPGVLQKPNQLLHHCPLRSAHGDLALGCLGLLRGVWSWKRLKGGGHLPNLAAGAPVGRRQWRRETGKLHLSRVWLYPGFVGPPAVHWQRPGLPQASGGRQLQRRWRRGCAAGNHGRGVQGAQTSRAVSRGPAQAARRGCWRSQWRGLGVGEHEPGNLNLLGSDG
eukprot:RCo005179